MVAPGRGHLPERLRAASGQGQQPRALVGALGRAFRRWRRLLEHDVGVGAGDTERADTGQGGTGLCGPGRGFPRDRDRQILPRHRWVRLAEVKARRNRPVAKRERGLDETGHSGGTLGVADVGLDGADAARPAWGPVPGEHVSQRLQFHGVAGTGAGAVSLDVLDLPGIHAGRPVRLAQHVLLALTSRRAEETAGLAVVVHRAAEDDGLDRIAVGQRP